MVLCHKVINEVFTTPRLYTTKLKINYPSTKIIRITDFGFDKEGNCNLK
jgi:hypothetical protein